MGSGDTLDADRVVAIPQLSGPRIAGLPVDRSGFVTTDGRGSVVGLPDVYAAGDMTSFPVKQGGLAAQQADAIAQRIAFSLGASAADARIQRVLRARLLGGAGSVLLRAELDEFGQPAASAVHTRVADSDVDEGPEKVVGRYLLPYLQARTPLPVPEHGVGDIGLL